MGRKGAFYSLMDKNLKSSVISMQKKQMIFCEGSYVVDGVLMGDKSLISNEEQILKKFTRF